MILSRRNVLISVGFIIIIIVALILSVSRVEYRIERCTYSGLGNETEVGTAWVYPSVSAHYLIGKKPSNILHHRTKIEKEFQSFSMYDLVKSDRYIYISNWYFGKNYLLLRGLWGGEGMTIVNGYENNPQMRSLIQNAISTGQISEYELFYLTQLDEIPPNGSPHCGVIEKILAETHE